MALPKQATAYTFTTELVDQTDTRLFKSTPTLASGDWKISKDQGSFNNLGTLPTVTPAANRQVKIVLSATEMTADDVGIEGVDAAGAEWCDVGFHFSLGVRNADDLAFPATTGRSTVVNSDGTVQADVRELLGTAWLAPAVAGTPDVNTKQVGGVAQTAGDLFLAVTNIAVTGAALNATASSATYTTGTSTGGVANTATLDGVFDSVAAVGNAIDVYYEFDLSGTTGAVGVGATWDGYLVGAVNTIKVYAYNWAGVAWDQIGTVTGIAGTVVGASEYDLTSAHTGTGGNAGKVRVRFAQTGLTTGTLKTDRILLGYVVQPLAAAAAPANFGSLAITAAGGVTLGDGVAHGGIPGSSTATFAMSHLRVKSASSLDAVMFESTAAGGSAFHMRKSSVSGWAWNVENVGGGTAIAVYGDTSAIILDANNSHCISMFVDTAGDVIHGETASGHGISVAAAGAGKHDIDLAGSGDILGDLAGTTQDITTTMTESYAAVGAPMTPAQALHMIWSLLAERNVSSTTLTAKKLDGSTTAMTLTLNSATQPTGQTRST